MSILGAKDSSHSCPRRLTTIRLSRTPPAGRSSFHSCRPLPEAAPQAAATHLQSGASGDPRDQLPKHVAVVMDGNGLGPPSAD